MLMKTAVRVVLVTSTLVLLLMAADASAGIYNKTVVRGYLVTPIAGEPVQGQLSQAVGIPELYRTVMKNKPVAGGKVSVKDGSAEAVTDAQGFFEIRHGRWFFQQDKVTLSISGGNGKMEVPIALTGRQTVFMVAVMSPSASRGYFREDRAGSPKIPVVLASIKLFFSSEEDSSAWVPMLTLLKQEGLEKDFDFYEIKFGPAADFKEYIALLDTKLKTISRLNDGKPMTAVAFSLGALAVRYYSVCSLYSAGMIGSLLQIAPPNNGLDLPWVIVKPLDEKRGNLLEQVRSDSRLIELLNRKIAINKEYASYYQLNPAIMDEKGFNPSVRVEVIAGEVMRDKKEALKGAGEKAGSAIASLVGYISSAAKKAGWETRLFDDFQHYREGSVDAYKEKIQGIPDGDMVVSLRSALVPGIPATVVKYGHFDLVDPEGVNDVRYQKVRDFILSNRPGS